MDQGVSGRLNSKSRGLLNSCSFLLDLHLGCKSRIRNELPFYRSPVLPSTTALDILPLENLSYNLHLFMSRLRYRCPREGPHPVLSHLNISISEIDKHLTWDRLSLERTRGERALHIPGQTEATHQEVVDRHASRIQGFFVGGPECHCTYILSGLIILKSRIS